MKKEPQSHNGKKETHLRVTEETELMTFLLAKMGGMSRNGVKSLLAHRQVQVNGHIETQFNLALKPNDKILISNGRGKQELVHPKLKVVYEDDELIVVEKSVGLLTVATMPESKEMTVFSILKSYVRQASPRAGIYVVHRLDRETSGLLVFAKNKDLQEYMRDHWREIVSMRTYVALAEGTMEKEHDTITTWLTENPRTTRVYSSPTDNGGKIAITHYKTVKSNADFSLLELHLETGRTNQIRVHMAEIGHPVVGDRKYGSGNPAPIDRLALHARILEFTHPGTHEKLHFETPVPRNFLKVFHENQGTETTKGRK